MRSLWMAAGISLATVFSLQAQTKQQPARLVVASYNVENLYDTLDNPLTDDAEFLPGGPNQWNTTRYRQKLARIAEVIDKVGGGAQVVGLVEIENRAVLADLVAQPILKAKGYEIVHYDSPDERGVDVALLFQNTAFKLLNSRPVTVNLPGDKTRDILQATLVSGNDTITFFVNHWPSRREGQKESENKRMAAATALRTQVDSLLARNANARFMIMGDFNDEPQDSSIVHGLRARPASAQLQQGELYNCFHELAEKGEGTYQFKKQWDMIDQIIISPGLLNGRKLKFEAGSPGIFKPEWLQEQNERFKGAPWRTFAGKNYLGGYSDHFPIYVTLQNLAPAAPLKSKAPAAKGKGGKK